MAIKMKPKRYLTWTSIVSGIYLVFGVALILQPQRWKNTPSYANLLTIAPTWIWGLIHLCAGALLTFAFLRRDLRKWYVAAHTLAIALTSAWLVAFVVRYLTDDGTTVVNVVSWSVFLALLVQSAISMDTLQVRLEDTDPGLGMRAIK